ncbi:hypothetical protein CLV58_112143 [Spirosoma oryzae]|uniref:Uncharacterized protein n=1 Tax=Spirosoma oryzae TaxID=1469603 RepID=A0A2T0ST11_9BACT|nr:hypothetical protein [Spirosoma oryzae]PRY36552.1 hypothetical protein CLV58_112143 [Spirosoma oryzae]
MQSAIPSPIVAVRQPVARPATEQAQLTIPLYLYAVVFASFCIVVGLLWDIMWHMSIGRDGLLAPPHLVIYVGAVIAGLFSAYQILSMTFSKKHPGRATAVPFWGVFYGPLGAMFCVWGALTMLTSAPFDDWWHNTYGLDVQILTPPHTVLAIGIMTLQFGAVVSLLALQNRWLAEGAAVNPVQLTRLKWLVALASGLLLTIVYTLASESLGRLASHRSTYYSTAAIIFPLFLLAIGRALKLRWPVTTVAGLYMLVLVVPSWVLQFFPATPRLGPVLNPITTYQPFMFPLLLIVPALAVDWLMHRFELPDALGRFADWKRALIYGGAFLLVFLAVQWPFGGFLATSPYARNGFFLSYMWPYDADPTYQYRFAFNPRWMQSASVFWTNIAWALLYATLSGRIGLLWGNWMKRIVR